MSVRVCDLPGCPNALRKVCYKANAGDIFFCCDAHHAIYHGELHCYKCRELVENTNFYYDGHYFCKLECRRGQVQVEPSYIEGQENE